MKAFIKKYWGYLLAGIGFLGLCIYAFISTEGRIKLEQLLKEKQDELNKQEEARKIQEQEFELQKKLLLDREGLSISGEKEKVQVDKTADNKLVDNANNLFKGFK